MEEFLHAVDDAVSFGIIDYDRGANIVTKTESTGFVNFYNTELLLDASREAMRATPPYDYAPRSFFGKLLLEQQGVRSPAVPTKLVFCAQAESTLLSSLGIAPPKLSDLIGKYGRDEEKLKKGPLVCISHEGRIVAVQKNIGEPSVYALETNQSLGLVERTFSAPYYHIRPSVIVTDSSTVKAEATLYSPSASLPPFSPYRQSASVFSIEPEKLVGTAQDEDREYVAFLAFNHEAVTAAVHKIAGNTPLPLISPMMLSWKEPSHEGHPFTAR